MHDMMYLWRENKWLLKTNKRWIREKTLYNYFGKF